MLRRSQNHYQGVQRNLPDVVQLRHKKSAEIEHAPGPRRCEKKPRFRNPFDFIGLQRKKFAAGFDGAIQHNLRVFSEPASPYQHTV